MTKKKIILLLLIGFIVSQLFQLSLMIVNDKLFIEQLQIQKLDEMLSSGELQVPKDRKLNVDLDKLDIKWPWYSIVFFLGVYSTYWYFFGRFYRKKLPDEKWTLCLLIPTIMGLTALNAVNLIYIAVCYSGGKLAK